MSNTMKHISDITVTPVQSMGGDAMVAAAAWVSTSGEDALRRVEENPKAFRGLIKSLIRQRHGTPFEHAAMTFFVHAPIFVWREWHRHRIGFSYNEESGRYKKLEPVFWIPRPTRPMLVRDNHSPMRPRFDLLPATEEGALTYSTMILNSTDVDRLAYERYSEEIEMGIANEVARRLLPLSIYSSCWVTCNPRSLMNFLGLRTFEPDAQYVSYPQAEIEEAARAAEQFLAEGWPITYEYFNEFGRVGV